MPCGIGESAVEIAFFKVQYDFFPKRNIFGEEIMEVVELQSKENTGTVCKTGGEEEIEKESPKTACFPWGRRLRSS